MPSTGREFMNQKCVVGGSNEYTSVIVVEDLDSSNTSGGKLGINDSLSLVFDNDIILDDIMIKNPDGVTFDLKLVFPTGNSIDLTSGTTDFSMNKPGDNSNIWYRSPKWTKIKLSVTPESGDGVLQLSVVGRG